MSEDDMSHRTHNRVVFTKVISGAMLALCLFLGGSMAKGDWKSDANARIEQYRKRNAQITVVDMNGQPVHDINVQIAQTTHSFAFGSCFNSGHLNDTTYTTFFKNHFEWAVCENESKWTANEPTKGNVPIQTQIISTPGAITMESRCEAIISSGNRVPVCHHG